MLKLSRLPLTKDVIESAQAVRTVRSSAITQMSRMVSQTRGKANMLKIFQPLARPRRKMGVKISLFSIMGFSR